jgi:uncharacterized metal-binding protein YceD (DUF177 family)
MTPEWSRPIDPETVSETPRRLEIGADEQERSRLAGRFRLQGIERLSAEVLLTRRAGVIHADGRVCAAVVQSCVVTGDPVPADIDAPFHVRFVPDAYAGSPDEEVELSAQDCDTLPLDGAVDLGELAAETLALALDPFPRCARADVTMAERASAGDQDAGPFAGLQALKDSLEKGGG